MFDAGNQFNMAHNVRERAPGGEGGGGGTILGKKYDTKANSAMRLEGEERGKRKACEERHITIFL